MNGQPTGQRFDPQAGIAIGPILFIIAILAILAAAIAAGSGSFTSSTAMESNRTKASALIQMGENLKMGMDRVTMNSGIAPTAVDINPQDTSDANALFSPTGGGVAAPSVSMSNNPSGGDVWYYVQGPINGFGSSAPEVFAVLPVSEGVCAEINKSVTGTAMVPEGADLGNFASQQTTSAETVDNWPPALSGVSTGCVNNTNNTTHGTYYYYQVLAIQ